MHKIKKNTSGFAMLEVVLAVIIISVASFGIYKLYQSSAINNKLFEEENLLSKLVTTINQMAYTYNTYPTADQLYNSGVVPTGKIEDNPNSIWPSANDDISAPFGGIHYYYDKSSLTCSRLVHNNIPGSVAKAFAEHLQKLGDVSIEGNDYTSSTVFENATIYQISVSLPHKGNC